MRKMSAMPLLVAVLFVGVGCSNVAPPPAPAAPSTVQPAAAPTKTPAPANKKVLRLGHGQAVDSMFQLASQKFADGVAAKSNGGLEVQIFLGAQLGDADQLVKGAKIGLIDFMVVNVSNLDFVLPQTAFSDLLFLFRDRQHAFKVLDGPIGAQVSDQLLKSGGVRQLNFMETGWRHFTTFEKPINTLADVKGMKSRSPDIATYLESFQALGMNPTSIAFSELFSALQHRVVDGTETALDSIYSSKFYQVQKYLALTSHVFSASSIYMSDKAYQALSPEYQKAIMDAAKEAQAWERDYMVNSDQALLAKLKDAGMTVTQPTDLDKWAETARPVQKKFATQWGMPDLPDQIAAVK